MAIDWIKVRCDLQSHPKVVRILSATSSDKFRVIGGLHAVWSVFDAHSEDGVLAGYTPELMDHIVGWEGFSAAMISVEWLKFDGKDTLMMPEFTEHNGKSGKRRAEDQKRKRDDRKRPQSVRKDSDINGKKSGLDKIRKEKNKPPISPKGEWPRFDEFWEAYPRKVAQPNARKSWNKIKPDGDLVEKILSAVRIQSKSEQWVCDDGKFIPHPATWLNANRWGDEVETSKPAASLGGGTKIFRAGDAL